MRDLLTQAAEVLDEPLLAHMVGIGVGMARPCHSAHEVMNDVDVGNNRRARRKQLLQFIILEGAVLRSVDPVPLLVQSVAERGHAVVPGERAAAAALHPLTLHVGRPMLPRVEEHLLREGRHVPVLHGAADDVHEPVGRVLELGHGEAQALEITLDSGGRAQVDRRSAAAQEQDVVDERKERVPRLVDDHDARHAEQPHSLQRRGHEQGAGGIEPCGGLVEEEHARLGDEFQADVHPLALAAADAFLLDATHEARLDVGEPHDAEDVIHDVPDPPGRDFRVVAQHGGELELLPHREVLENDVILRHEPDNAL
mmetsp:Transcript_104664/g.302894  ORF Transcript_104664/g.302894 Transcript_104664/m.302894 type:complete len:312 (+) Transcript_104664:1074-2009(+)